MMDSTKYKIVPAIDLGTGEEILPQEEMEQLTKYLCNSMKVNTNYTPGYKSNDFYEESEEAHLEVDVVASLTVSELSEYFLIRRKELRMISEAFDNMDTYDGIYEMLMNRVNELTPYAYNVSRIYVTVQEEGYPSLTDTKWVFDIEIMTYDFDDALYRDSLSS